MKKKLPPIKPCPFCGWEIDHTDEQALEDTLYRNGIVWRMQDGKIRFYSMRERHNEPNDGWVWELNCNESMGGCGATMHGLTEIGVIGKWNRRTQ